MALSGTRTFVGFGLGAIQSGLFLTEAFRSGHFRRLVVAEIEPEVVASVRAADGKIQINIAYQDRIEKEQIDSIEIENPADPLDRQRLIDAIAEADEIATAVPSVEFYSSERPYSLDQILAAGLCKKAENSGPRAVVYTAENHNQAAEILEKLVISYIPAESHAKVQSNVQFLNTVIGKMSHVVSDPEEIIEGALSTMTPEFPRAFLVESFNKIFISKINFQELFQRGIDIFEEKNKIIRFEEAKLYGHNAVHALAGYVAKLIGIRYISDLREVPDMLNFLHTAFIDESGKCLIRKYDQFDPLFTPSGFNQYAENLVERMTNPYLKESVERVTRDTPRKLGWDDRLIGTMRLALDQGVEPMRFAFGTAAALASLDPCVLDNEKSIEANLNSIWANAACASDEQKQVIALIKDAMPKLKAWRDAGYPNIETFIINHQPNS